MKPYSDYRSSGVEWLGEVPMHWKVRPFRRALRESLKYGANEAAELDDPDLPRFIRITDIDDGGRLRDETFRSLPVSVAEPYLLEPGDLLFARSGSVGRTFLYDESWGACAYAGYLIRARVDRAQAMPEFVSYFSESHAYVGWLRTVAIQATIENVSAERYARMLLPLPPRNEQRTIVAFLDCETERIDALVAKMRLLIGRLQEYRIALMTRTVTRGLPPYAARVAGVDASPRLKPSGVEWLGDVPEHWDVGNIRRYAEMKSGHTPSRQHPEYWEDCEIPWFTLADVWQLRDGRATYLDETRELISHLGIANSAAELLPADTVILSRIASIGFSGIMPVPMATSQDFWNWVCGPKLTPKYLLLTFRSMHNEFNRLMMGSTHRTIYEASAASICIPVPPIPEQQAIVQFLEERLQSNDAAVEAATRTVERLQEYRTALITSAVTGKVDVRESVSANGS